MHCTGWKNVSASHLMLTLNLASAASVERSICHTYPDLLLSSMAFSLAKTPFPKTSANIYAPTTMLWL